ncbi:MAG: flagellar basal body rod protein FlgB [Lachnospiraceae bacterium]|jgi:flagellar basal-body rod protein FlgB|nr:flagellar basal body rod protein FlgB [Lachnospiraceae bacterium]MCR4866994.1 flagellar basal body rod protein FlgB [Lachnospiraceae bacterium]
MYNSGIYSYINVLNKAADASWERNELISNNIANQDTPGYKRQDIDFESQLSQALKNQKYTSIDAKVKNVELSRLKGRIYTDYGDFSYRVDGNNVDPEQEQVELASNQLKYQGLIQAMTKEFANIKSVLK